MSPWDQPDEFLIEAAREVDAFLPESPPIAPALPPPLEVVLKRSYPAAVELETAPPVAAYPAYARMVAAAEAYGKPR